MIKPGVDLRPLTPPMALAYAIVQKAFHEYDCECVITSGADSQHGANSLHPSGNALDFRTKHVSSVLKMKLVNGIRSLLGEQFDVVYEADGKPNEHLHVEFDPKESVRPNTGNLT
jgi:hypothetical protein